MKRKERFREPRTALAAAFACRHADTFEGSGGNKIRGDVFFRLYDGPNDPGNLYEERALRNLVVLDASIIIARLLKDNQEPPKGIYVLAVGTGDVGWDLQSPPAATNTQRALYSEITRKTFSQTQFIDGGGSPTAIPTNVVDFTTVFTESEAVGPLVEMSLLGGNIDTNLAVKNPVSPPNGAYDPLVDMTQFETAVNYLTFPVVNKPATSTLEIVWRLTT